MAPNLSGIDAVDQARSVHLAELAFDFACAHLQPGGDFAVKVFQGSGLPEFEKAVRAPLRQGRTCAKPKASRDRSREVFVVAKGSVRRDPRQGVPGRAAVGRQWHVSA